MWATARRLGSSTLLCASPDLGKVLACMSARVERPWTSKGYRSVDSRSGGYTALPLKGFFHEKSSPKELAMKQCMAFRAGFLRPSRVEKAILTGSGRVWPS
ncbi:hypothetical protein F751_2392 [Auxenochlorella protothecoides]|uniref:Uncharacterized protein n=1 Tax=Auxenochlorella protothecoides TaxID=3075 RepID=A0A087SG21_AUXPR|nr:hypothetical protein F751_2392 [Auxenochlorella protothecoides]KFM24675.1 hypothetical protein F751_2392 [Auxenochlorella protothecoides]